MSLPQMPGNEVKRWQRTKEVEKWQRHERRWHKRQTIQKKDTADDATRSMKVTLPQMTSVAAQPKRNPRNDQKYMQDDPQWDREVRGATAVLEDLLEKWKEEPYTQDHVRVGRVVGVIGRHVTPACDLPRTVRKSLDELAPRLKLEFIADASYLIIINFIVVIALVGHALRIALAIAYGILKTFEHVQQAANRHLEETSKGT
ncbi:hypothetical protein EDB89DRAFT_1913439 [Lactarius sanguifluus]|nr:hypothetical protein EDB89DRAFT_1913439 [Lactarius sanguifluus]